MILDQDLAAIKEKWLRNCGACDLGMPEYGCNHPTEDYRPVMAQLVAEIEGLAGRLVGLQAARDHWHDRWQFVVTERVALEGERDEALAVMERAVEERDRMERVAKKKIAAEFERNHYVAAIADLRDGDAFRRWFHTQNYNEAPPPSGYDWLRETLARYLEARVTMDQGQGWR